MPSPRDVSIDRPLAAVDIASRIEAIEKTIDDRQKTIKNEKGDGHENTRAWLSNKLTWLAQQCQMLLEGALTTESEQSIAELERCCRINTDDSNEKRYNELKDWQSFGLSTAQALFWDKIATDVDNPDKIDWDVTDKINLLETTQRYLVSKNSSNEEALNACLEQHLKTTIKKVEAQIEQLPRGQAYRPHQDTVLILSFDDGTANACLSDDGSIDKQRPLAQAMVQTAREGYNEVFIHWHSDFLHSAFSNLMSSLAKKIHGEPQQGNIKLHQRKLHLSAVEDVKQQAFALLSHAYHIPRSSLYKDKALDFRAYYDNQRKAEQIAAILQQYSILLPPQVCLTIYYQDKASLVPTQQCTISNTSSQISYDSWRPFVESFLKRMGNAQDNNIVLKAIKILIENKLATEAHLNWLVNNKAVCQAIVLLSTINLGDAKYYEMALQADALAFVQALSSSGSDIVLKAIKILVENKLATKEYLNQLVNNKAVCQAIVLLSTINLGDAKYYEMALQADALAFVQTLSSLCKPTDIDDKWEQLPDKSKNIVTRRVRASIALQEIGRFKSDQKVITDSIISQALAILQQSGLSVLYQRAIENENDICQRIIAANKHASELIKAAVVLQQRHWCTGTIADLLKVSPENQMRAKALIVLDSMNLVDNEIETSNGLSITAADRVLHEDLQLARVIVKLDKMGLASKANIQTLLDGIKNHQAIALSLQLSQNEKVFEPILSHYFKTQSKSSRDYSHQKKTIIGVGSARQNALSNANNGSQNGNGDCFYNFSQLADKLNAKSADKHEVEFSPLLLFDILNAWQAGQTIDQGKIPRSSKYPNDLAIGENKSLILLSHMYYLAGRVGKLYLIDYDGCGASMFSSAGDINTNDPLYQEIYQAVLRDADQLDEGDYKEVATKKLNVRFYDDREDILEAVEKTMEQCRVLLPAGVSLTTYRWASHQDTKPVKRKTISAFEHKSGEHDITFEKWCSLTKSVLIGCQTLRDDEIDAVVVGALEKQAIVAKAHNMSKVAQVLMWHLHDNNYLGEYVLDKCRELLSKEDNNISAALCQITNHIQDDLLCAINVAKWIAWADKPFSQREPFNFLQDKDTDDKRCYQVMNQLPACDLTIADAQSFCKKIIRTEGENVALDADIIKYLYAKEAVDRSNIRAVLLSDNTDTFLDAIDVLRKPQFKALQTSDNINTILTNVDIARAINNCFDLKSSPIDNPRIYQAIIDHDQFCQVFNQVDASRSEKDNVVKVLMQQTFDDLSLYQVIVADELLRNTILELSQSQPKGKLYCYAVVAYLKEESGWREPPQPLSIEEESDYRQLQQRRYSLSWGEESKYRSLRQRQQRQLITYEEAAQWISVVEKEGLTNSEDFKPWLQINTAKLAVDNLAQQAIICPITWLLSHITTCQVINLLKDCGLATKERYQQLLDDYDNSSKASAIVALAETNLLTNENCDKLLVDDSEGVAIQTRVKAIAILKQYQLATKECCKQVLDDDSYASTIADLPQDQDKSFEQVTKVLDDGATIAQAVEKVYQANSNFDEEPTGVSPIYGRLNAKADRWTSVIIEDETFRQALLQCDGLAPSISALEWLYHCDEWDQYYETINNNPQLAKHLNIFRAIANQIFWRESTVKSKVNCFKKGIAYPLMQHYLTRVKDDRQHSLLEHLDKIGEMPEYTTDKGYPRDRFNQYVVKFMATLILSSQDIESQALLQDGDVGNLLAQAVVALYACGIDDEKIYTRALNNSVFAAAIAAMASYQSNRAVNNFLLHPAEISTPKAIRTLVKVANQSQADSMDQLSVVVMLLYGAGLDQEEIYQEVLNDNSFLQAAIAGLISLWGSSENIINYVWQSKYSSFFSEMLRKAWSSWKDTNLDALASQSAQQGMLPLLQSIVAITSLQAVDINDEELCEAIIADEKLSNTLFAALATSSQQPQSKETTLATIKAIVACHQAGVLHQYYEQLAKAAPELVSKNATLINEIEEQTTTLFAAYKEQTTVDCDKELNCYKKGIFTAIIDSESTPQDRHKQVKSATQALQTSKKLQGNVIYELLQKIKSWVYKHIGHHQVSSPLQNHQEDSESSLQEDTQESADVLSQKSQEQHCQALSQYKHATLFARSRAKRYVLGELEAISSKAAETSPTAAAC